MSGPEERIDGVYAVFWESYLMIKVLKTENNLYGMTIQFFSDKPIYRCFSAEILYLNIL